MNERSIQRDIDDTREFLEVNIENTNHINYVMYDHANRVYRLEQKYRMDFTNSEVLAICKMLLDSRAFTKKEITNMLDKLISCCVPRINQKLVADLIINEEFHYVEPRHKTEFMDIMWNIGQSIRNYKYLEIDYHRIKDRSIVKRKLKPVAIMSSEYYFYLIAFIDEDNIRKNFNVINDSFPTIYRIDRIKGLSVLEEKFHIPYSSRFEEGEFRKRIQFMYGGKLEKVKFKYSGTDIDAVLDCLKTAQILAEENGAYTVSAEVFGKGIDR